MPSLTVVRFQTVPHEQGWHWAIRLDPTSPSTEVRFFDASMGFGWKGFKQRERSYATMELAATEMPPIADEHLVGEICGDIEFALAILRVCPVKVDERWNCQDWVRECLGMLDVAGAIVKPGPEVSSVWNNGMMKQRAAAMPGMYAGVEL